MVQLNELNNLNLNSHNLNLFYHHGSSHHQNNLALLASETTRPEGLSTSLQKNKILKIKLKKNIFKNIIIILINC